MLRRGWLAPAPLGAGVVVVDTIGRRSGQPRRTPLLAARIGNHLFVGTVRGSSDWVANIAADPEPLVATRGGAREVQVEVRPMRPVGTLAVLRVVEPA
ncbi:MAG: nitroreductase family deazaflavin-dependent oxidoreductase [Actinomycetota bacterium]|nr:nitroreductase family deazaflavin-dependent oxidoreductase [Actinomycetota bacterium]